MRGACARGPHEGQVRGSVPSIPIIFEPRAFDWSNNVEFDYRTAPSRLPKALPLSSAEKRGSSVSYSWCRGGDVGSVSWVLLIDLGHLCHTSSCHALCGTYSGPTLCVGFVAVMAGWLWSPWEVVGGCVVYCGVVLCRCGVVPRFVCLFGRRLL